MLFPTILKLNVEWNSLRNFPVTPPPPALKYLTLTVNHCHSSKNYISTLWQPRNVLFIRLSCQCQKLYQSEDATLTTQFMLVNNDESFHLVEMHQPCFSKVQQWYKNACLQKYLWVQIRYQTLIVTVSLFTSLQIFSASINRKQVFPAS